jgi:hypothetical protein
MRAEAAITKLTIFSSHGKPLPGETLKDAPLGSQVGQVTLSKVTPTLEQLEDRAEAMPHSDAAHNLRGRGRRVSNASVADQRRLLADRFDRTFATTADITRVSLSSLRFFNGDCLFHDTCGRDRYSERLMLMDQERYRLTNLAPPWISLKWDVKMKTSLSEYS